MIDPPKRKVREIGQRLAEHTRQASRELLAHGLKEVSDYRSSAVLRSAPSRWPTTATESARVAAQDDFTVEMSKNMPPRRAVGE